MEGELRKGEEGEVKQMHSIILQLLIHHVFNAEGKDTCT